MALTPVADGFSVELSLPFFYDLDLWWPGFEHSIFCM